MKPKIRNRFNPFRIATVLLGGVGFGLVGSLQANAQWNAEWEVGRQGFFPDGAFTDPALKDSNGSQLYVCKIEGANGKLSPRHQRCYVPYGGREIGHERYQVLLGDYNSYKWVRHTGRIPSSAVYAGDEEGRGSLYVCKAKHEGVWVPGKFLASLDTCNVPYGGKEYVYKDFYVLTKQ